MGKNKGRYGRAIGDANRAEIRALMKRCLGISRVEMSERLGLNIMAVGRHVASIRAEWGGK